MMIQTHGRGQGGFTLIETILTTTIVAGLVVTMATAQIYILERSEQTRDKEERLAEANVVFAEIEQAIRMSEEVLQADDAVLALRTRYFVDLDDGYENVRYTLSGGQLQKAVADEVSIYAAPTVLLDDITAFVGHALDIEDSFDRADYEVVTAPTGTGLVADPSTQVKYRLKDLGQVDGDLTSSYDPDLEHLEIECAGTRKTVTVSPATRKQGLLAAVDFVPLQDSEQYHVLAYGTEDLGVDSVSVVFGSDNSVRIQHVVGNVTTDQEISGTSWSPLETYRVKMIMDRGRAVAWLDRKDGNGFEKIGAVTTGTLDDGQLHFETTTDGGKGAWDDLLLGYPFVEVSMTGTTGSQSHSLHGGAGRRIQ